MSIGNLATIAEIARHPDVEKPEHAVRADHRAGRLPGGHKIGSTWVFTENEVESYVRSVVDATA